MSWKKIKLGDVLIQCGTRAKELKPDSKIPFLGVSNVDGITNARSRPGEKKESYILVEENCFAYNPYRINVGSIGLMPKGKKGLVSPAYVVFRTNENELNSELLIKFLKSSEGIKQIRRYARGTVRQALRFEDLCGIELRIPTIDEQKQLINQFYKFEQKNNIISTELDHQVELVTQLRQAILREAMQGKLVRQNPKDEPASELLKKIKAEKEKLIKEKKLKKEKPLPEIEADEIPFAIPENWAWCRLGECSMNYDGDRMPVSKIEREGKEKIYDYYGASGVIDKIDSYTHEGEFLLIGEDGANLVARSTPVAFIARGQFWVNNHAHVLKTLERVTLNFLCYYFNSIDLKPYITGGFQPKLSQGNLNLIPVVLPPYSEQHRIVAKLEQLMQLSDDLEKSIQQSKTQTGLLLQSALRDALKAKDSIQDCVVA